MRVYGMLECPTRNTYCGDLPHIKQVFYENGMFTLRAVKLFAGKIIRKLQREEQRTDHIVRKMALLAPGEQRCLSHTQIKPPVARCLSTKQH